MTADFHERRRQKFLHEPLYIGTRAEQLRAIQLRRADLAELRSAPTPNHQYVVATQAFVYREKFWLWMLDYTAGAALPGLAARLGEVVDEFVEWHRVNKPFRQALREEFPDDDVALDASPIDADNIIWYEDALQLVSVALLLRDAVSVKRILQAIHPLVGSDGLLDHLLAGYLPEDTALVTDLLHEEPYRRLLDCWDIADDAQALKSVEKYLKAWYKSQDGARWHDGHLKVNGDVAPYYGYWAFEAAAVCYVLQLDDSRVDHLVYPQDLARYARDLRAQDAWTSGDDAPLPSETRLRALPGTAVPQAGWWVTPALAGSSGRRFMQAGERLPDTASTDWGEVVWHFERP